MMDLGWDKYWVLTITTWDDRWRYGIHLDTMCIRRRLTLALEEWYSDESLHYLHSLWTYFVSLYISTRSST